MNHRGIGIVYGVVVELVELLMWGWKRDEKKKASCFLLHENKRQARVPRESSQRMLVVQKNRS